MIQPIELEAIYAKLESIEGKLSSLIEMPNQKEWYSTAEVAEITSKSEFTTREHCRLGRYHAAKRQCGRGKSGEWMISHEELVRIQNEGLLPRRNVRFEDY
jgi:hypothetical protein